MRPYRYICHDKDPQWLEERRKVFTASEIAAFFGEGYKSQKEVLLGKFDLAPSDSDPDLARKAWWGREMERANMRAFSALTGFRSRPVNAFLTSVRLPSLGCTIDGLTTGLDLRCGLLEMKNVEMFDQRIDMDDQYEKIHEGKIQLYDLDNRVRWRNGFDGEKPRLPKYRWIQVQAQLYVTGYPFAVLCAKIGAADMVWHTIYPDELFFLDLEEVVRRAQKKLDKMRERATTNKEVTE